MTLLELFALLGKYGPALAPVIEAIIAAVEKGGPLDEAALIDLVKKAMTAATDAEMRRELPPGS